MSEEKLILFSFHYFHHHYFSYYQYDYNDDVYHDYPDGYQQTF